MAFQSNPGGGRGDHPEPFQEQVNTDVTGGGRKRYLPLQHVYSATSPCVCASGSSNVMSKKVRARKLQGVEHFDCSGEKASPLHPGKPPLISVYVRRRYKRKRALPPQEGSHPSFLDSLLKRLESREPVKCDDSDLPSCTNNSGNAHEDGPDDAGVELDNVTPSINKRRHVNSELARLGVNPSDMRQLEGPRLRECKHVATSSFSLKRNRVSSSWCPKDTPGTDCTKRWVSLSFDGVEPKTLVGLQCKVYWPLDAEWYHGNVTEYNLQTGRHHVEYDDGDEEDLIISNEKVKWHVSHADMQRLKLSCGTSCIDSGALDYDEMVVLAASLDDSQDLEPGDIIWAKLSGHAMWPAIVVDESLIGDCKGLTRMVVGRSVPVQFFGTHDFARVKSEQVISFLRGLLSSFHLKCRKPHFLQSLEEAKMYLSEQKFPRKMICVQNGSKSDDCESATVEDEMQTTFEECRGNEKSWVPPKGPRILPFQVGNLKVISLGKIVKGSKTLIDEGTICPEGYTAVRKFTSITDPSVCALYKMEVLRDAESKFRLLFRVTSANEVQFEGSTPSACWTKIYKRIKKMKNGVYDANGAEGGAEKNYESGSDMFGLSNPEIVPLIQELSKSTLPSKLSILTAGKYLPAGYRPVRVDWKDLDKCNVCHMDEEYENNLFLQCDKCRMMVHARCYGELEPVDGALWLCNLCRPGAPESTPLCCLCPVIGGAMKPTTDGRWAHLACAIWIPETCLSDIKTMEPIDGLNRINKERWKLLCSICGVPYGACIQCSNSTCYVAYHPLCARAAGLCVELEDEDKLFISIEDEDEDQCIRLLSFCKKHRQPSNERSAADGWIAQATRQCSMYNPPSNPTGCARSEPYNYIGRRGRKAPEALEAASSKRLFVENRPYMVSGYCSHEPWSHPLSVGTFEGSLLSVRLQRIKALEINDPKTILSMPEKYEHMKKTSRKRLAFGKSGIHGFGIFAKCHHRAGDMVIEYTGELVRPLIADRRERLIYNSLVGAGTYMFRVRDDCVIDATRAGSIAHLINHSCEPNCYSRYLSVNGNGHIIIFAKRDIMQWEELTYDYRFFSIDERLPCYCGFPSCRGVVNDMDAEEGVAKMHAPRTELVDWKGD